jgi:hypothetical protein
MGCAVNSPVPSGHTFANKLSGWRGIRMAIGTSRSSALLPGRFATDGGVAERFKAPVLSFAVLSFAKACPFL